MLPNGTLYVYADGWIYYRILNEGGTTSINRMRDDGTGAQHIVDTEFGGNCMAVAGDVLYFTASGDIFRVNTDGSGLQLLSKSKTDGGPTAGLCSTGDYVYIRDGGSIYCYSADPWELAGEIKIPGRLDYIFQIVDGWIYLADDFVTGMVPRGGGRFYRVRTDGTENSAWFKPALTDGETIRYWSVLDGNFYYQIYSTINGNGKAELRRVNLDGTGDEFVMDGLFVWWFDGEWAYGNKFGDEPWILGGKKHFMPDDVFWRTNIATGELEILGNYPIYALTKAGDKFIYDASLSPKGEKTALMLYNKDMTNGIPLPIPDR